jgi:eukaryotic-like serine/threonine-protein kinase
MNPQLQGKRCFAQPASPSPLPLSLFWANKDTMQFWNELEGRTIDGRHPLRRLIRSEGRRAWFESEAGDPQGTLATLSLTEALTDADEVVARLQAAHSLNHPNLVTILKIGQVNLDNTLFVYAVMEHIEQSLSDVLQSQALSPEEAREVAEAMVGALTVIHQKGMSHGHVEAASVLATEETVKLRSDCLQDSTAGQADDVAGIGATLFHAFTQRKGLSATDAQINRIPAPFAEIVRSSFAGRWNLAQVANALKPAPPVTQAAPPPPPPPPPAPPPPAPVIPPPEAVAVKAPVKTPPARPPAAPVAAKAKPAVLAIEEDEPSAAKRIPLALYVGLGVLVLAIITWLVMRPGSAPPPPQKAATPTTSTPAAIPTAPPPAPVVPKPSPVAKKPSAAIPVRAATPLPQPAASAPAANGRSVWRVIAYTYRRQQDAIDMVARISAKHPNLKVEVFTPPGRSIYLVSLGGGDMDREAAAKMLDKARSMGLPDDTYVQNFAE